MYLEKSKWIVIWDGGSTSNLLAVNIRRGNTISEADLKVQVLGWFYWLHLRSSAYMWEHIAGLQQVTGDYVYLVVACSISPLASVLHHGWNRKRFCYISPISPPGNSQQWPMGVAKQKYRISWIRSGQRRLRKSGWPYLGKHCSLSDANGRPVLHTELVELGLNDLHDLGVLRVLVGDIHV